MINVLYSSLVVCFCLMFSQTKYEYDLLLLRQNDSLYFIYTLLLYVVYIISIYTVSLIYFEGVFIWRINYCHIVIVILSPKRHRITKEDSGGNSLRS